MGLGPRLAVETAQQAERRSATARSGPPRPPGPRRSRLLAAAGAAAPSLDLGTGVLALQLRTPMVVAMGAATLQALHPERDILLGVGISSPVVTQRWHGVAYGERPLARVREYVTLVKACLSGETVDFEGDFYTVKRLPPRRPARRAPAEGRRRRAQPGDAAPRRRGGRRRAAQLPAGLARAVVGRAGPQAGGDADDLRLRPRRRVRARGRHRLARRDLFSYAVVDAYARNFERAGFGDEVAEIRERHAAGDREGALAAVSRPHGRRHRRDGRRRPRPRHRARPTSTPASTCPCSCRCRGAPTAGRSSSDTMGAAAGRSADPAPRPAVDRSRPRSGRVRPWSSPDKVVVVTGAAQRHRLRARASGFVAEGAAGRGRRRPRRRRLPRRSPTSSATAAARHRRRRHRRGRRRRRVIEPPRPRSARSTCSAPTPASASAAASRPPTTTWDRIWTSTSWPTCTRPGACCPACSRGARATC